MTIRRTGKFIGTGLVSAIVVIVAFGYSGGPAGAIDAQTVVNNALKATSVAGGFDSNLKETMYVMTVTNGDNNDIVSLLGKNGNLSTFVTLPPRATGETSPRVDVAVVRAADGEFKNYLNHLLVSRGQRIYLISPGGTFVQPSPLITMTDCPTINSIVIGSKLFDRKLIVACSSGKIFAVTSAGITDPATPIADLADSTVGRIDIAPANFWHNGVNYGRRVLAYSQSAHALYAIAPSGNPVPIPVPPALLPGTTKAATRTVPSILCSYLNSPTDGSTVIASDAFIQNNNRNAIYRSPRSEYSTKEGHVLLFGDNGSRVFAMWDVSNPFNAVTFSEVHASGTPTFNGVAFCPVFFVSFEIKPTSAQSGSPGKGITTGNITFSIESIKLSDGTIILDPHSSGPTGVNQATLAFGLTGVEATYADGEMKCTNAKTDVNNDGIADLHCSAKASATMLFEGAEGVVTFVTNDGNPRDQGD